jgi:hypothetical protein
MDERDVVFDGELSLETTAAILLPLEPLWDPFAHLGPAHLDLSGVTFIWPAAITLLTTTVLCLRQDGFEVRFTRPASESVTDRRITGTTSRRPTSASGSGSRRWDTASSWCEPRIRGLV